MRGTYLIGTLVAIAVINEEENHEKVEVLVQGKTKDPPILPFVLEGKAASAVIRYGKKGSDVQLAADSMTPHNFDLDIPGEDSFEDHGVYFTSHFCRVLGRGENEFDTSLRSEVEDLKASIAKLSTK